MGDHADIDHSGLPGVGTTSTRASLGLDTTDSPQFAGLNVGAATDTTITRTGAGDIAVEGNAVYRAGGTDVPIGDGGTGASTKAAAFDALSPMTTADDIIYGGASGTGTRLGKGSDGQVLTVDPSTHHLVWATPTGGFTDPMTSRGDVIIRNSSNTTARLAKGSADTYLGSDGTDVAYSAVTDAKLSTSDITTNNASTSKHGFLKKLSNVSTEYMDGTGAWSTPAGGGGGGGSSGALVFLEEHVASSSATLDFTSFISSTYDEYVIEGVNVVPATNAVTLAMRVGTGGGPTYDTSSNYYTGASGGTSFSIASPVPNNAGYGQASFSLRLMSPQSTAQMKQVFGDTGYHNGTNVVGGGGSWLWADTPALTAVRFFFSSGNIASGTIRIYGVSKTAGAGSVGMALLEQHTASSSSSLDFTSFISSTYDTYKIEIVDLSLATNAANLLVEAGTGGGPTWDTGSNYEWAWPLYSSGGSGVASSGSSGLAPVFTAVSNNSGYGFGNASLTLMQPQSTTHRRSIFGNVQFVNSTPANVFGPGGIQWTNITTAMTGLRFLASSGNIAAGTIRIYGVSK